jgi:hypothetical protein
MCGSTRVAMMMKIRMPEPCVKTKLRTLQSMAVRIMPATRERAEGPSSGASVPATDESGRLIATTLPSLSDPRPRFHPLGPVLWHANA